MNALVIARERGIRINEEKTEEIEDFANLISVEVKTNKVKNFIMGTLFTKIDPRLVKINQFYVDAIPEGNMLMVYNQDKPGIVGHIGGILAKHNINVAGMTFGRAERGGLAMTVINVDNEITKDILDKIKKGKHIKEVKYIKL